MGKYKSYIFLGITVLILLLVGYCVAKNSKGKKEEKELTIDNPKSEIENKEHLENNETIEPINNNNNTQIDNNQTINSRQNIEPVKEKEIQESPKIVKTPPAPEIDLNLRKNKNQISWNPELSKPGINLSLVIYRYEDGIATDPIDVSNLSSYVYEPGAEGNNLPSKVTLKVQSNIKVKGKNFLDEVKFTCKAH